MDINNVPLQMRFMMNIIERIQTKPNQRLSGRNTFAQKYPFFMGDTWKHDVTIALGNVMIIKTNKTPQEFHTFHGNKLK